MGLHIRYRPGTFEEVAGNVGAVSSLKSLLSRSENIPHSFLFTGPSGSGKTTLARIAAGYLGAKGHDFIEVDVGDFRGIDTIRNIRQQARLAPVSGKARVWLLDEAHQLSNDAQNALLKILEEPPAHVYFMICTTNPQKLIPTITNRCATFSVESLDSQTMYRLLRKIVTKEGKKLEQDVYDKIIDVSEGSPRKALTTLDKIIDLPKEEALSAMSTLSIDEKEIIDLCRGLMSKVSWKDITTIIKGLGDKDPEQVRRAVLGYFCSVLLSKDDPRAFLILDAFKAPFYNNGKADLIMACYASLYAD